ncbi:DNA pilot protein [Blackfly microvirus SF02]|uniref:DNA pilot protein n=1 Tax=Blackfly microvirus SF02 TaxID=2576452 RepID=A0A4P8PK33_9VIRU|nr:DNA pilot protein [Blackfly microvirus SF02]
MLTLKKIKTQALMADPISTGVATVAGVATAVGNAISQKKQNERNVKQQNKWRSEDRAYALADRENEREYNLEKNQIKRMEDAGINPVYGMGNGISSQSPTTRSADTSSPNTQAPQINYDPATLAQLQNLSADTQQKNAQSTNIQAETDLKNLELARNQGDLDLFTATYENQIQNSILSVIRNRQEIDNLLATMDKTQADTLRSRYSIYFDNQRLENDAQRLFNESRGLDIQQQNADTNVTNAETNKRRASIMGQLADSTISLNATKQEVEQYKLDVERLANEFLSTLDPSVRSGKELELKHLQSLTRELKITEGLAPIRKLTDEIKNGLSLFYAPLNAVKGVL